MPINIYSVANHLEEEGWQLISDSYKNLDTELEMKCPEGHLQTQTYRHWRKHPQCEVCMAGDPYKVKKNKVPTKKIDTTRILALDAATVITGYSIYDNISDSDYEIKAGDRIAQVWVERVERFKPVIVDILPATDRGDGGFGSTGK